MKNKYYASFLAFFLGAIGAHKFYLGDKKWGFVFLVWSWTGIPALMGVIESIKMIRLSDKNFESYCEGYIKNYNTFAQDWEELNKNIKNIFKNTTKNDESENSDKEEKIENKDTLKSRFELSENNIIQGNEQVPSHIHI